MTISRDEELWMLASSITVGHGANAKRFIIERILHFAETGHPRLEGFWLEVARKHDELTKRRTGGTH